MKSKPLPMEVKRFVVKCAARYDSPSEIVRAVGTEFGVQMTRAGAQRYDPTRSAGASLSAELRELFERERRRFIEQLETVPLAHRAVRLRKLESIYDEARQAGNLKVAVSAIATAGREMTIFDFIDVGDDDGGGNV